MRMLFRAFCITAWGMGSAWGLDATDVKPVPGLIISNTVFATTGLVTSGAEGGFMATMDTEDHFTLEKVAPDGIGYQIKMSAPGNARVEEVARKLRWPRAVRREDLETSTRMTLLYASTDAENYAGQTFAETSRKVLEALKTSGATPFVFGPYELDSKNAFSALMQGAQTKQPAPLPNAGGAPPIPDLGSLFHMLFGSARHYYRGTLHRVETQDVAVAVLVNGVRTSLAAVHAAGSFTFGSDEPQKAEVWWLDNPDWPLTLHWVFGPASDIVTRIDWPTGAGADAGSAGSGGGGGGGGGAMAAQLASKACRAELHGIYFNSGSAVLLEESDPMLKQLSSVVKASAAQTLTIEGHTDNIGSADYNQTLSDARAAAVRDALVNHYGVPPARLTSKGYGLTRPVESNATIEGRARNRRVELSRDCAGGH